VINDISILIIGDFDRGNTNNFIYNAFSKVVNSIYKSEDDTTKQMWGKKNLLYRIMWRLKFPIDTKGHNELIKEYVDSGKINTIMIIKGNHIKPSTLKYAKRANIKLLSWSDDDMFNRDNRSYYYDWGLKYYDMVITQKSYNCNLNELPALGAKYVFFRNKAYDKDTHRLYDCSNGKYNFDVLFIGHFEEERYKSILYLAENGVKVDIFGPAWGKYKSINKNLMIHDKMLVAEEYANALSCAKISLCFLRKVNRDLQTSRTMEIPACGGFMLAERTNEHLKLFKEDEEAAYFNSNEELLEKTRYYLENEERRKIVANNGRLRCERSSYSYDDRAQEIVNELKRINNV
jgi:spore maturation protein CgeB